MRLLLGLIVGILPLAPGDLAAQSDSAFSGTRASRTPDSRAWIVPLAVGVSVAFDEEAREGALASHTHSLDRLAKFANPLGTAKRLVPAMALTYGTALVTRNGSLERGVVVTAAGYAAADLVESALKPIAGRERPHATGNSRRFHPFTANGDWHSFPSAHVSHITSIVEAISEQMHSTPISVAGDALVALVGWDRVYEDQHWTSDVAATVALSSLVSSATVRWLESHWRASGAESRR